MKPTPSVLTLEALFPIWEQLSPQHQQALQQRAALRHFARGEHPHRGGGDCDGLFIVAQGRLRVYMLSETGREITLYRLFERDICLFSASCILKNIQFELQVEAETDTLAYVVPASVYEHLMHESLALSDYTGELMASRFSDVMWVIQQVLFTRFESRLAGFLLEQRNIDEDDTLHITHEAIARHLGSAREVVTKMLNYLAQEGLVELSRGKITLTNLPKLRTLAST